jgi:uncharacterized protein (TIGR03435 family)
MRIVSTAGLIILTSSVALSQSAPTQASFEVASIKVAAPPTDGRLMVRMGGDPGRIDYTNVSVRDLIRNAYRVKDHQISGPDWLGSQRFDVTAKLPDGASKDQVPEMLQTLLADRFKLTFHKEPKVLPAYALTVAKAGPKLHEAKAGADAGPRPGMRMMMGPKGRHMTGNVTMQMLADNLSNWMDRPVIDMTGLKGTYAVDMEWSGDDGPQSMRFMRGPGGPEGGPRPEGGGGEARPTDPNADAPTLFTALQDKLGLKLDPRKESVDILIIDHAEKLPTEN